MHFCDRRLRKIIYRGTFRRFKEGLFSGNKTKRTGKPVICDMVKSALTRKLVGVFCAPTFADNGNFLGIFGMLFNATALSEIVNRVLRETGYAVMGNQKGGVIAHPNQDFLLTLNLIEEVGMKGGTTDMLAGKQGAAPYAIKGVDNFLGYAWWF